jgi:hypothetical protein
LYPLFCFRTTKGIFFLYIYSYPIFYMHLITATLTTQYKP